MLPYMLSTIGNLINIFRLETTHENDCTRSIEFQRFQILFTYGVGDGLHSLRWNNGHKVHAFCSMGQKQDHLGRLVLRRYHQNSHSTYHKMRSLGKVRLVLDTWSWIGLIKIKVIFSSRCISNYLNFYE